MNALTTMVAVGWMPAADGADLDEAITALCRLVSRQSLSEATLNAVLDLLAGDLAERAFASLREG